ncbi:hypothetical protein K438DRAFT_1829209 [Mycena galopus ATCC 62051]|nr:hypothetical protein K438DRAFT_1829209 [Mycena galopus ATCC 62051]
MRVSHPHYHACEVCSATVPYRQTSDAKSLKMCPCQGAFYCGSKHQKLHWKIHKQTCYIKAHPGPLIPIDAVPDCDLVTQLEKTAVVVTLEQAVGEEPMLDAVDAGRIPPYTISQTVALVSLEEEAKKRGHSNPFFEHPVDRERRMACGDLIVTLIFQPGGRIFTKKLDHLVYAANMRIGSECDEERNVPVRCVPGVVQFKREEFLEHGIGRLHLKPTAPITKEPSVKTEPL